MEVSERIRTGGVWRYWDDDLSGQNFQQMNLQKGNGYDEGIVVIAKRAKEGPLEDEEDEE